MTEYVFKGERKAETFSLCFKPFIQDEKHYEPHLSEKANYQASGEISERVVLQKANGVEGSGNPLTPLLPDTKRNKDNLLESFLEDKTMLNVTKIRTEGNFGFKFGEGGEKKWKEPEKQKD